MADALAEWVSSFMPPPPTPDELALEANEGGTHPPMPVQDRVLPMLCSWLAILLHNHNGPALRSMLMHPVRGGGLAVPSV